MVSAIGKQQSCGNDFSVSTKMVNMASNVKWTTNLSNNLTVLSNNLALTRHKAYKVRHAEF